MNKIKTELTNGLGYVVLEKLIPEQLIDSIVNRLTEIYPVRASSRQKKYAEKEDIKDLPDISVWWSQMIMDWPEFEKIHKIVYPHVLTYMPDSSLYASDIVVIEPDSTWINPHVDTPHRFKDYNYDKRLLGIQTIISLFDLNEHNGATGLVPKSQNVDFNINFCYKGLYNDFFNQSRIQPNLPKGSVLMYNCRLLHSSMPNKQKEKRPALLINYLDNSIIETVKSLDNIWTSNN